MGDVCGQVKHIVSQVLCMDPSEIDETELLLSLGMNSVDLIDVVVKLEEQFQVRFDPNTMKDLTCRSLADNVEALKIAEH